MVRDSVRPASLVVVGVDGSQGSARALSWALSEARSRQAPVRVVTVWAWDTTGAPNGAHRGTPRDVLRRARQTQEALIRLVLARFPGRLPQLQPELVEGDPASALIERSRDGDLLVLGSRGLGAQDDAAVGSVADACLRHGSCPVVVVPNRVVVVPDPVMAVPDPVMAVPDEPGQHRVPLIRPPDPCQSTPAAVSALLGLL